MYTTRFLYLGYLDFDTGTKLVEYLKVYIKALVKNLNDRIMNGSDPRLSTVCEIDNDMKVLESTRSYRKIAIKYDNYMVKQIIVPILRLLTDNILTLKFKNNNKSFFLPHINLMSITNDGSTSKY